MTRKELKRFDDRHLSMHVNNGQPLVREIPKDHLNKKDRKRLRAAIEAKKSAETEEWIEKGEADGKTED